MIEIRWSREAAAARAAGRPLVALESVILAHGLPRPRNLEVGRRVEAIVRDSGAAPVTLALREGALLAGLEPGEMETVAASDAVAKVNLGNLAAALARGGWGATTVSTSLWACARAGIETLVTGGIGGAHRGFGRTLDISSDLTALSRWPVLVVCAGVKSLLDVAATREHLETLGAPVLGWRTDCFPRFYLRESAIPLDARVETAAEVARIARLHWSAGGAGIVLAAPCPEAAALREEEFEEALALAEFERETSRASGRDATPFLLARLHHHTRGRTLEANVALIENNARVGAEVAAALASAGGRA